MKFFLLICSILFLFWCEKNQDFSQEEKIEKLQEKESSQNTSLAWDKEIPFIKCESILTYKEEERSDFYKNPDVILLQEKIKLYNTQFNEDYFAGLPHFVREYCKSEDGTKFIFSAESKVPLSFWRYDKTLDIIEETSLINFVFPYVENFWIPERYGNDSLSPLLVKYIKDHNSKQGFWKRTKNIIEYKTYGYSLVWHPESAPWLFSNFWEFFTEKNIDYCQKWLTPEGKNSVCFVNITYHFDYLKNEFYESEICSFYYDDWGNIRPLEKCFQVKKEKHGFPLISQTKWTFFYQNTKKDISIFEANPKEIHISFWGILKHDPEFVWKTTAQNFKKISSFSQKEIFAVISGYTNTIDFLKSNNEILYGKLSQKNGEKALVMDNNKSLSILKDFNLEYLKEPFFQEIFIWTDIHNDIFPEKKLSRNYIWINNLWNIFFFIGKNKTQEEMLDVLNNFQILEENTLVIPSSPTTQFAIFENNGPWSTFQQFYSTENNPHFFFFYK